MEDPREASGCIHRLGDIVVIALCAAICGAEEWNTIQEFGRAKQEWFETFLALPHGIPSEDTFARVLPALHSE